MAKHDTEGTDAQATDGTTADRTQTTSASTFQEAADAATPSEVGTIGVSPERERTGREDKGLSQRNPAILQGGPVPDSRPGVDDSEAIAALREDS